MSQLEQIFDTIEAQIGRTVEDYAPQVVAAIQNDLSTDYPPSSVPGESPHRRTGNLWRGVSARVVRTRDAVEMIIRSERVGGNPDVPFYLNFQMNRPYFSKAEIDVQNNFAPTIVRALAL